MHMADALLSPAVGGTMCAVSAGIIAYCSRKVRDELDDRKVPLMGVLGAFLFAAQMINFTIPATGSSGHLGGGLLLAILLGPHAAFLTIASVLVVQALFFADGGLLALGCNIFNMGYFPAFLVYPLIYKNLAGHNPNRLRLTLALMVSAIAGLQLGAFSVVLETALSGISSLPFSTFALLMQTIHLAIGVVEGLVTSAIVAFVYAARPEIIRTAMEARYLGRCSVRTVGISFLVAALLTGGILSWFASNNPDGLEWAIARVTGKEELAGPGQGLHGMLTSLQQKTAFLPGYAFKKPEGPGKDQAGAVDVSKKDAKPADEKMVKGSKPGTSVAGLLGTLIVLALVFFSNFILKMRSGPRKNQWPH